jgi:CheY-like chemotaxis protein
MHRAPPPELASILLIDSNASDLTTLRESLAEAGIANPVIGFTQAADAMAFLDQSDTGALPSLVICEVLMPGHDGFETLRWVRRHAGFGGIKFALVTSHPSHFVAYAALVLGADAVLSGLAQPAALAELLGSRDQHHAAT